MSDLDRLVRQVDRVPAPNLWPGIESRELRSGQPSTGRRVLVAAVALPVAAAGIVLAAMAFFGEQTTQRTSGAVPEVDPRVVAEIDVGQFPQEIAAGAGAIWVTVNDADPPERWFVARIDPSTNRVTDEIDLHEAHDVAVGAGAVWVAGRDRELGPALFRIDPDQRGVVATIPLGCQRCHPDQVAAADDAIWLTLSTDYPESGQVLRVDPLANEVAARVTLPGDPRDLAVGAGAVWVYSLTHFTEQSVAGGTLYRIDPSTASVTVTSLEGRIPPAAGVSSPPLVNVSHGFVWTSSAPGNPIDLADDRVSIVRIDGAEGQVSGRVHLGSLFFPFASDQSSVWFQGGDEYATPTIGRLDPATMAVTAKLRLDTTVLDGAIDQSTGSIWVSTYRDLVLRVDLYPSP
jgi:streptogramin lyase